MNSDELTEVSALFQRALEELQAAASIEDPLDHLLALGAAGNCALDATTTLAHVRHRLIQSYLLDDRPLN